MSWQEADRQRFVALESDVGDLAGVKRVTAVWDPASAGAGAEIVAQIAVPGAAVGDAVAVGFSQLIPDNVQLTAVVSAADSVRLKLRNNTAGAVDLASGTVKIVVFK